MIGGGLVETLAFLQHSQHRRRLHVFREAVAELGQGVGGHVHGAHFLEDVPEMGRRRAAGILGVFIVVRSWFSWSVSAERIAS